MPELLIEVGCEELPATFVRRAYSDLRDNLVKGLVEAGLVDSGGDSTIMGTPRRLIVGLPDVRARQEDSTKEQKGPALKAAYDADGNPTPALLGFCRSQGIDPGELRKDEQYVWVTKQIAGRSAQEILQELIPQAIRALNFDKAMRWGSSRLRFARPIRWLLATYDGQVVPFEIEGVPAGDRSQGHRFYSPEAFQAVDLGALVAGLRQRKVEPDPAVRKTAIVDQAKKLAGEGVHLPEALVDENVYLTEWPTAIKGAFRTEFEHLPTPVLVTAMAKHEKMFPVSDAHGKLTNEFVFIRNSGEDDTVRKGTEWVLNARFNDAKFFFDEDVKHSLGDFLERTSGIVFQEKLGTVRSRADRLAALCAFVAEATGADKEEIEYARQAGLYAKADLSTGLVSELSSLQGVVGGEYAKREGMADAVCWAIASHYDLGKNSKPDSAGARTAVRLTIADQLDKLAGYLGIGLEPTGSSDPYGLRRAVTMLIEAAWAWPSAMPSYSELFVESQKLFTEVELAVERPAKALEEIFESRYGALLPEVRYDVLQAACLPDDLTNPQNVRFRIACLESVAGDIPFIQTATRPLNIVASARKNGSKFAEDAPLSHVNRAALGSADGEALLDALAGQEAQVDQAGDVDALIGLLRNLAPHITQFFDSTMVMAEQEDVRFARLSLLQACSHQLLKAGDFSKLVVEG